MSICKAASCVDFSQDVPSHCVGFALKVALDLGWDFIDAEEDKETCSHSDSVRGAYVWETSDCRYIFHSKWFIAIDGLHDLRLQQDFPIDSIGSQNEFLISAYQ